MKRAGYQLRPFDFSVKGVTSISADPHKVNVSNYKHSIPDQPNVILISVRLYTEGIQHHFVFEQKVSSPSIHRNHWLAGRCLRITDSEWVSCRREHSNLLGYNGPLWRGRLHGNNETCYRHMSLYRAGLTETERHLHLWNTGHVSYCNWIEGFRHLSIVGQFVQIGLEFECSAISVWVSAFFVGPKFFITFMSLLSSWRHYLIECFDHVNRFARKCFEEVTPSAKSFEVILSCMLHLF